MGHTYTSNLYHCVFSTKERANLIPETLLDPLWNYIGGIARTNGLKSLSTGGTHNHVHILLSIPATMPLPKAMQLIKGGSSKWLNEHTLPRRFQWQDGYGAFSIGISQVDVTRTYIAHQAEHHRKRSFEEEFVFFLNKHGIEYDPRYVLGRRSRASGTAHLSASLPAAEAAGYSQQHLRCMDKTKQALRTGRQCTGHKSKSPDGGAFEKVKNCS